MTAAGSEKGSSTVQAESSIHPIIESYRTWVVTLAGYMSHAVGLLEDLYAEQDEMIDQLRQSFAKRRSLRRVDFNAIFGKILDRRQRTRGSLAALVEGYRAGREAVIQEVRNVLRSDPTQAVEAWPAIKARLLDEQDGGAVAVAAALRHVHIEQEELSTALSALSGRAEELRVKDLRAVVKGLAARGSKESAELVALLAMCESAGRNAGLKWQRLAG